MRSILAFIRSLFKKLAALFSGKTTVEEPASPDRPSFPDGPDGPVVCYYGCPNSKKAEKLQLGKTTYR